MGKLNKFQNIVDQFKNIFTHFELVRFYVKFECVQKPCYYQLAYYFVVFYILWNLFLWFFWLATPWWLIWATALTAWLLFVLIHHFLTWLTTIGFWPTTFFLLFLALIFVCYEWMLRQVRTDNCPNALHTIIRAHGNKHFR